MLVGVRFSPPILTQNLYLILVAGHEKGVVGLMGTF